MYAIHQYIFWTWSNWLAYQSILKRWLFSMLGWKYSYHVAAFKCGACTTLAVDYSRSNWGLIWTWTWAAQDSFESSAKVKEKLWKVLNHKAYIPPPFSHIFILSHLSQMRHNISELCSDVPDTRKNGQGKPISWVNIIDTTHLPPKSPHRFW